MWAYRVLKQCHQKNIDFSERAIFLCGKNYRKYLMKKFSKSEAPLKNMTIGKQLQYYKLHINKEGDVKL